MRYTASNLTAAPEGPVLRIGPSDDSLRADRTVRGRLRRWWVQRFRTWYPKPLSVPQMLALQATGKDAVAYLLALLPILRAVLPRRWWYRVVGDPVRLLFALPADLLPRVLQAIVTVPGTARDVSRESSDPHAELRRKQRASVNGGVANDGAISLAVAAMSVRAAYGDAWYFNPDRWPTSDGYVPFAVALVEAAGVQALDMRRRLEVFDGYSMVHATHPRRERDKLQQLAYPGEVG